MLSPKFLRAMWSPQPPEGQVQMEQQCSFHIYAPIWCNTHFHTSFSVLDSVLSHGYTCLPGILCVQKHMDEV